MPRRLLLAIATMGLLLAPGSSAVSAVRAGGGCHPGADGSAHTDGPATVIRMDVCSFAPTVARVPVGTEVRFLNTSPVEHVVLGRGQSWGGGPLASGQELIEPFGEPGIYPYSCPLHAGMVGTIVVGDAADGVGAPAEVDRVTPAPEAAPAPANVRSSAGDGVLVPLMAGGVGLALGLLVAAIVARARRDTGESTAADPRR